MRLFLTYICLCGFGLLFSVAQNLEDSTAYQIHPEGKGYAWSKHSSSGFLGDLSPGQWYLGNFGQERIHLSGIYALDRPSDWMLADFMADSLPAIYATTPYSQIAFSNTYDQGQLFRASLARNINPRWTAAIRLDRNNATGEYQRSSFSSNLGQLNLARVGDSLRWKSQVYINVGKLKRQVNGGIVDVDLLKDNVIGNRQLIPVAINGAEQEGKLWQMAWRNQWALGANVDSSKHAFVLGAQFKSRSYAYRDNNPTEGYYQSIFIDSAQTLDSIALREYILSGGYAFHPQPELNVYVGLKGIALNQFQNQSTQQNWLALEGEFSRMLEAGTLEINFDQALNQESFGSLEFKYHTPEQWNWGLSIRAFERRLRIDPWFESYSSNHMQWSGQVEQPKNLGLQVAADWKFLTLGFDQVEYRNRLFVHGSSGLIQARRETWFHTYIKVEQAWTHWLIQAEGHQQGFGTSESLQLPDQWASFTIAYRGTWFKGALPLQIGIQGMYWSDRMALVYRPDINQMVYGSQEILSGYAPLSAFVDLTIKSATVRLKYSHLNEGLMGYDYFLTAQQPLNDGAFFLAVRWNFWN